MRLSDTPLFRRSDMSTYKLRFHELTVADKLVKLLRVYWEEVINKDGSIPFKAVIKAYYPKSDFNPDTWLSEELEPLLGGRDPEGLMGAVAVVLHTRKIIKKHLDKNNRLAATKALAEGYYNLGIIYSFGMQTPKNFAAELAKIRYQKYIYTKNKELVHEEYHKIRAVNPSLSKDMIAEIIYNRGITNLAEKTIRHYLRRL